MQCAECGERLPDGACFCTACGRRVGAVVICPQCETQAPDGAKFCFKCGAALGEATAPHAKEPGVAAARAEPVRAAKPAPARERDDAPAPERVEPRLDLNKVRATEPERGSAERGARTEPTVKRPGSSSAGSQGESAPRDLRKIWPLGMVALGALLATAAYWSAAHDDAVAKAAAAQRVSNATGPRPTTQEAATGDVSFSQPRSPGTVETSIAAR
jgi:hypothetical protein